MKKIILYIGCFRSENWESIWQRENMLTHAINSKLIVFRLRNLMRQHEISCFDAIIISNPTFFARDVLRRIKTKKLIYDCGERYEFSENHTRDVVQFEKSILEKADIVTADSVALRDEKRQIHDHVITIVQGIDLNNYNANRVSTAEEPSDLAAIGRPRRGRKQIGCNSAGRMDAVFASKLVEI